MPGYSPYSFRRATFPSRRQIPRRGLPPNRSYRVQQSRPYGPPLRPYHRSRYATRPLIIVPPKTTNPLADSGDSLRSATNRFSASQIHYWRSVTTNQWILKTILQGYSLQFRRRPPVNTGIRPSIMTNPQKHRIISMEIQTLLGKEAIEEIKPPAATQGIFSVYFIILKKRRGFPSYIGFERSKQNPKIPAFSYASNIRCPTSNRASRLDGKSGFKGRIFPCSNCASSSPLPTFPFRRENISIQRPSIWSVFSSKGLTKVVQAALAPLQQKGICVLPYLDDWLLCAENPTKVTDNLRHLLAHIAKLGFSINQTKCQLIPGQCIQFLGVQLTPEI